MRLFISPVVASLAFLFITASCASSSLKYEKTDQLKQIKEFDESVKIVKPQEAGDDEDTNEPKAASPKDAKSETAPDKTVTPAPAPHPSPATKNAKKSKTPPRKKVLGKTGAASTATPVASAEPTPTPAPSARPPDIEDSEGFAAGSRRPLQDPFRVGEVVIHDVHYFKVSAGELKLKVEPFSTVNNRKSYTFAIEIRTSSVFNAFYSVEDRVETFVDYEDLVPRVFQLHVKESKQLREAKMLFDVNKNTAKFWEKKVTSEDGEEEKKQEWEIQEFSQNIYSAAFYMRNFKWETGKEYAFRVANDNENLVFSGKALRREVLDTKLGPMKAIVIQPNIVLKGKFKPIGENLIWLSDDDRKYILRIEAKIKIGTLISEVISIKPGKP